MTTATLREELHTLIDAIPDRALVALKPLLQFLAEDYSKPVVEPANQEERALIEEGMREYEQNPESFITLSEYKKRRGIET